MRSWLFFISGLSIGAGILFFAYRNEIILIRPLHRQQALPTRQSSTQSVRLTFFKSMRPFTEQRTVLWDQTHDIQNVTHIIHAYWALLEEEHIVSSKIPVQLVTTDAHQTTIICSIGISPFQKNNSSYANWLIIEGLLKNIRDHVPRYQSLVLLLNNQPLQDYTISAQCPWPLEGFMQSWTQTPKLSQLPRKSHYTLLLNPAGDTKSPGRSIGDSFERSLTLAWATELKKQLAEQYPHIRTIITRTTGEHIEPLYNASFANRMQTDLYIHVSLFETQENSPELYIHTYQLNPVSDTWKRPIQPGAFIPYHHAHQSCTEVTNQYAQQLRSKLALHPACTAQIRGVYTMPYYPLIGIAQPAIGIELGIQSQEQWQDMTIALAETIGDLMPQEI